MHGDDFCLAAVETVEETRHDLVVAKIRINEVWRWKVDVRLLNDPVDLLGKSRLEIRQRAVARNARDACDNERKRRFRRRAIGRVDLASAFLEYLPIGRGVS